MQVSDRQLDVINHLKRHLVCLRRNARPAALRVTHKFSPGAHSCCKIVAARERARYINIYRDVAAPARESGVAAPARRREADPEGEPGWARACTHVSLVLVFFGLLLFLSQLLQPLPCVIHDDFEFLLDSSHIVKIPLVSLQRTCHYKHIFKQNFHGLVR